MSNIKDKFNKNIFSKQNKKLKNKKNKMSERNEVTRDTRMSEAISMSEAIRMSKYCYAKELDEATSRLKKAKHAVAILEKARVDPVVRGTATVDYVEDKLCRGKILINHLDEKIKMLRTFKTE